MTRAMSCLMDFGAPYPLAVEPLGVQGFWVLGGLNRYPLLVIIVVLFTLLALGFTRYRGRLYKLGNFCKEIPLLYSDSF